MPSVRSTLLLAAGLSVAAAGARGGSGETPVVLGADNWDMQATVVYPEGGSLVGGEFFSAVALPLPDGHWLVVGDRLVRFDAAGQIVSLSEQDPSSLVNPGGSGGAALTDDGEVLAWSGESDCVIALIAQDGSQRWRHAPAIAGTCGAVLLQSGRLHQVVGVGQSAEVDVLSLDRRGQTRWRARFPGQHLSRVQVQLAAAGNGGLLAASVLRAGAGAPAERATVALFDRDGELRQRWEGPPVVGLRLLALVSDATGGHWLAFSDSGGGLLKVHLAADLQVVSSHNIAAPPGQRVGSVLLDGTGQGYALQDIGNGGQTQWVHRIGPDALGWQYHSEVACPTSTGRLCQVLGRNGDLILIGRRQIERIDRTGARVAFRQFVLPSLGSIRWLGESPEGIAAIRLSGLESGNGLFTPLSGLEWLQESIETVASVPEPRFPRPQVQPAVATVDADGATVVALPGPGQQAGHLEAIEADGRRRWLGTLPALHIRSVITSGGDATCLLHIGHTACLTTQTGHLRWLRQHESSLYRWGRLLSDGTLSSIDSRSVFGGGFGFVERQVVSSFAPAGHQLWSRTIPVVQAVGQWVFGISESGKVAFRDQGGMLAYLDRTGVVIPTAVALPGVARREDADAGIVDDSGRVMFVSETRLSNEVAVTVVGATADGLDWQVPLGSYDRSALRATVRLIPVNDGGALVESSGLLRIPQRQPMLGLARLDAFGRTVWQRRWTARAAAQHKVVSDASGRVVRAVQPLGAAHLLLETLDAATGISLSMLRLPCPGTGCGVENVRLLPGGQVHMVSDGGGDSGLPHLVARLDDLPQAALAPARLGMAAGSFWQATDLVGSAISLSSPTPQRLVGAWATHSRRTDNSPAELRWYALDAQLLPGSNEAAVVISERPSGRFASGPSGPARQVGAGRLRFRGCDAGLMQYRFDEGYNDGVEGSLPLTRLLPPGTDCLEPDGRLRPAQANYAPDLSGHWYDPAAAGQGLELARAAPSAGQPGLLFGVWFTFGPDASATGPGNLRWFTLQGQAVEGGVVRSTLLASLGGRFDDVAATNTFPVGTVELVSEGCDRLRLRYLFDDDEVAGDFRALAGEINMSRLGACPGA